MYKRQTKSPAPPAGAGDLVDGDGVPPLDAILNLHDLEAVAQRVMVAKGKKQAWTTTPRAPTTS